MKKVLAVLAINPEYMEFAVPELKTLLYQLKIPLATLFEESQPLPANSYDINHKTVRNCPFITLTVPEFQKHRFCNPSLTQFLRTRASGP
jgi:hypothetical protein